MTQLHRRIGLLALTVYGVGDILGAGIYGLVGKAAGELGNVVWMGFLASMVAAGLTGLSYASIGSRYPRAGGAAYVTQRAFGSSFLAYVIGLIALASGLTSMAVGSRAFAGYFTGLVTSIPMTLAILGFCALIAALIIIGIREAMWANLLCTFIELSGLLLILACGASYWGSVDYFSAVTNANPSGDITTSLIFSGAVLTFYSFVGFEDILNVSEEVIEPERTVPRGLILAVIISSIVYMGISITAVSVLSPAELGASKQPLVDVMARAAPWFPRPLFGLIAMFAVANTALLNGIMGSRLMYGMAHQGLLPRPLAKVNAKTRTPHVAALIIVGIVVAMALTGDISALARATSILLLLCFCVVNLALVVLQRRKAEPKGKFEVPTIIPVMGALVCAAMLTQAKMAELTISLIILSIILVLYFALRPSAGAVEKL